MEFFVFDCTLPKIVISPPPEEEMRRTTTEGLGLSLFLRRLEFKVRFPSLKDAQASSRFHCSSSLVTQTCSCLELE